MAECADKIQLSPRLACIRGYPPMPPQRNQRDLTLATFHMCNDAGNRSIEGGAGGGGGNTGRTAAEGEFYNAPDGNPGQAIHREIDTCEQKSQILSWEGLNSMSSHYRLRESCLSKSSSQLDEIMHPRMAHNFELHQSRLLARLRNF